MPHHPPTNTATPSDPPSTPAYGEKFAAALREIFGSLEMELEDPMEGYGDFDIGGSARVGGESVYCFTAGAVDEGLEASMQGFGHDIERKLAHFCADELTRTQRQIVLELSRNKVRPLRDHRTRENLDAWALLEHLSEGVNKGAHRPLTRWGHVVGEVLQVRSQGNSHRRRQAGAA